MKLVLLMFCLAVSMMAQETKGNCKLSIVNWVDATLVTKGTINIDNPESMMGTQTTIGCVILKEHVVIVLMNFADGKPDTALFIPKEWMIEIIPLTTKETKETPKEGG
jgi:hypothetical protein